MTGDVRYALPEGFLLQDYRILSILGAGGFGVTYLAEDTTLGKRVALKEYMPVEMAIRHGKSEVLPKSGGSEDDFVWGLQEFLREARTLAQFEHPNIVPVLRFFEANGTAYIVMAFQEGESLSDILDRRATLDQDSVLGLLGPLIDGLSAVHYRGFLHRDIKPENIFIRTDGSPVLLDFGSARQALGTKTRTLTSIVSRGYAPFEQYTTTSKQGPWSDIYALAAVAYRAIAGAQPPDATDRMDRDSIVPALEAGHGRGGEDFLRAIDWALAVRSEDRPQSLAEWRRALFAAPRLSDDRRSVAAQPQDTIHVAPPPGGGGPIEAGGRPAPAPRRRATAPAIAGLVLLVLVAGGGAVATWVYLVDTENAERQKQRRVSGTGTDKVTGTAGQARGRTTEAKRVAKEDGSEPAADETARRKEEETKRRAEAEARRRIADEARRKVEAEVRRKAEAEARRRIADEARRKVEEEVRRKAQAEARRTAAADARRRALEVARRKARADARNRAAAKPAQRAAVDPTTGGASRLEALFTGGTVYATTKRSPLREDVWQFKPGGKLVGTYSEAPTNPQFPDVFGSDSGTWSVAAGRLCVQWKKWDGGRRHCYRITGQGRKFVARNGGGLLSGPFRLRR